MTTPREPVASEGRGAPCRSTSAHTPAEIEVQSSYTVATDTSNKMVAL